MKRRIVFTRVVAVVLAALVSLVLGQTHAAASLQLVPPTFVGNGGYSADGLGQNEVGGTVQAEVPVGSTAVQAFLYGTYFFNAAPDLTQRTIDFDGSTVVLDQLLNAAPGPCCSLASARADVTAQVAAKVAAGPGPIYDFAVNTDPSSLDGVGLVVIFSNPALPLTTIAVLDGGAEQLGDTTTFNFASPIDKTTPGFSATMSVGSGFSFQGEAGHICGSSAPQSSLVNVNGVRLTSCAGSFDDGFGNNGALITVGGVGDSTDNPADPFQQPADGASPRVLDDELYNIEPFLSQGDTQLVITTSNPSGDDILFLTVIAVTAEAAVTTEICNDGIDNDGDGLIDAADPDCAPTPPAVTTVTIDIKPGSFPNSIHLSYGGVVRVAILTTPSFDATTVDSSTVCFGDAEDPTQRDCTEVHSTGHIKDVDGDGDLDLVLHYETAQTGIDVGDTTACLTGTTFGGQPIQGCDSVQVIP